MGLDSPVDDNHDQAARSAALPSIFTSFSAHRFNSSNNNNNNSNSNYGAIAMNSTTADPCYGSTTANLMPSRGEDFSHHHHHHHHHQLTSYGNSSAAHHHHNQQQQHHHQQHQYQQLHSRLGVSEETAVGRASMSNTALGDFRIHSSPAPLSKTEEAAGGLQRSASFQQSHFEGNSLSAITAMAPRRGDQASMEEVQWQENQEQSNTNNNRSLTQTAEAANTDNSGTVNIMGANQTSLDQQLQDHQQQIINLQRQHQQHQQQQRSPSSSSATGAACQDCGNKAKKDCPHMRCRTCCKSRGFNCATHVKSTWVPVSKRRERAQQMQSSELLMAAAGGGAGPAGAGQLSQYVFRPPRFKRTRTLPLVGMGGDSADQSALHGINIGGAGAATSTSTGTPPRSSSDINSAGDAKYHVLPSEFKMQAVFRCVRLTGLADGQDEYAYQTAVRIGGHIFKGVLYDQSLDKPASFAPSSIAELQLGGRAIHSGSGLMDLGIYGAGGSAIIGAFR